MVRTGVARALAFLSCAEKERMCRLRAGYGGDQAVEKEGRHEKSECADGVRGIFSMIGVVSTGSVTP